MFLCLSPPVVREERDQEEAVNESPPPIITSHHRGWRGVPGAGIPELPTPGQVSSIPHRLGGVWS